MIHFNQLLYQPQRQTSWVNIYHQWFCLGSLILGLPRSTDLNSVLSTKAPFALHATQLQANGNSNSVYFCWLACCSHTSMLILCVSERVGEREKGWMGREGERILYHYQYHYQLLLMLVSVITLTLYNSNNFCFKSVAKVKSVFSCLHAMIDC